MYINGRDVPEDYAEAIYHYTLAAIDGNTRALEVEELLDVLETDNH